MTVGSCLRQVVCLLSFSIFLTSCSHRDPKLKPGTGDVSFRLLWQGEADLDLHVIDPGGRHTGIVVPGYQASPEELEALQERYAAEQAGEELAPGGVLDVDCNASPDKMCPHPIENVFWQPGTAPRGAYRFWAVLFQQLDDGSEVPFELEVRRGERVVESHRGVVSRQYEESERFEFVF